MAKKNHSVNIQKHELGVVLMQLSNRNTIATFIEQDSEMSHETGILILHVTPCYWQNMYEVEISMNATNLVEEDNFSEACRVLDLFAFNSR